MRLKTILGPVAAAALMVAIGSGTASATTLTSPAGTALPTGSVIKGELSSGKTELHPPIGTIQCNKSTLEGKTTNSGGAGISVNIALSTLTFSECNATVTVLKKGNLAIDAKGGGEGTVTGGGLETTVSYLGFHCIYSADPITLFVVGFIAGQIFATVIILAVLSRTGGSSGAFCGSTAKWTGTYKITSPQPLLVD